MAVDPVSWMTLGVRIRYSSSTNKYPVGEGSRQGFMSNISRAWPTEPVYTPNGDYYMGGISRVAILDGGGSDERHEERANIIPTLELRILKGWNVNAEFIYNSNNYRGTYFEDKVTGFAVDGFTEVDHPSRDYTQINQNMSQNQYYSTQIYTSYTKQFDNHFVNVMVGWQAEKNEFISLAGWKRDLLNSDVQAIRAATGNYDVSDRINHWSTSGFFSRLNYNFREKYLVEVNARYDGSSRFGEKERWGLFPSASLGYNISKESFWQPISNVVNEFKIRASYGSLGNQNVANYLHYVLIPINPNLRYIIDGERPLYAEAPGLGSTGLTWETSKTLNFGLDAEFLKNRLTLTFDVFNRRTENMVGPG